MLHRSGESSEAVSVTLTNSFAGGSVRRGHLAGVEAPIFANLQLHPVNFRRETRMQQLDSAPDWFPSCGGAPPEPGTAQCDLR